MTPRWSAGSRRLPRITMSWRRFRRRRSTPTRCCVRIRGTEPQRAHRHAGWAPPALMLMAHRVGAQHAAPLHVFLPALCLLAGCSAASAPAPPPPDGHLFTLLPSSYTGVRFENRLTDTHDLNVFTYRNYYNGGGVALGDLTGDGLPEIVLTSNQGGTRLYLNEGKFRFRDVTAEAGLHSRGWTTGVTLADVNGDGLLDIYVANDFFERDYLYINKGDGTFAERLEQEMPYISLSSMGLDIADVNNDGWPDVYVADMLPDDERRLKTTTAFENWHRLQEEVRNDFHYQFTRNMLHLNNGNGSFSDIGQMAGVARTDWSWSPLIADLDLDGYKDIYVTNGLAKDVTSQDYIAFLRSRETMAQATRGARVDFQRLVDAMSSTKLPNYAFRNRGDSTFANESASWGLDTPSFSSGAAYGDLDGDGAVDLVVNNVNQEAFVYRNNARTLAPNHYLQVRLEGMGANRFAIGAKVTLWSGAQQFFQEVQPQRGFQSSVDSVLNFGVGPGNTLESVRVEWPDREGRVTVLNHVGRNQRVTLPQSESRAPSPEPRTRGTPLLTDASASIQLPYLHRENEFVDFDREPLIPKLLSTEGPMLAVADVNGDGLDDMFIGGAKGQAGRLLVQQPDGRFVSTNEKLLEQDRLSEDLGAVFFDADGDGRPDLYVASGGSEFASSRDQALQDRLYLNDVRGRLRKAIGSLPPEDVSGSRVVAADYDGDGDVDLFVGGRVGPWHYGEDPRSLLLQNDGHGHFTDVTKRLSPELERVGMVAEG